MLVLANGRVFTPGGSIVDGSVVVDGDRIQRWTSDTSELPPDIRTIDVQGRLILPGFINAHSHLTFFKDSHEFPDAVIGYQAAANARAALGSGVTTIRDVGGIRHIDVALRDAINEGKILGPRLHVSGQFIARTGGHSFKRAREADGPSGVVTAVREQLRAGADLIKFMGSGGVADPKEMPDEVQFSSEELQAGIEEAHRAQRTVAVHAHPPAAMKQAILAGADFIEHGTFLTDEIIDLMLEKDVAVVPTMCVYKGISENQQLHPNLRDTASRVLDEKLKRFARAVESGVKWGVGLDNGTFYPHDGYTQELELLVQSGVSPQQALVAATEGNARVLGLQGVGAIEAGSFADLVVVPPEAADDVAKTRNPWLVVKNGVPFNESMTPGPTQSIPERGY